MIQYLTYNGELVKAADGKLLALAGAHIDPITSISGYAAEAINAGDKVYCDLWRRVESFTPTFNTALVGTAVVGAHMKFQGHDMYFFGTNSAPRLFLYEYNSTTNEMIKFAYNGSDVTATPDPTQYCEFFAKDDTLFLYFKTSSNFLLFEVDFINSELVLKYNAALSGWIQFMYCEDGNAVFCNNRAIKPFNLTTYDWGSTIGTIGSGLHTQGSCVKVRTSPEYDRYLVISFHTRTSTGYGGACDIYMWRNDIKEYISESYIDLIIAGGGGTSMQFARAELVSYPGAEQLVIMQKVRYDSSPSAATGTVGIPSFYISADVDNIFTATPSSMGISVPTSGGSYDAYTGTLFRTPTKTIALNYMHSTVPRFFRVKYSAYPYGAYLVYVASPPVSNFGAKHIDREIAFCNSGATFGFYKFVPVVYKAHDEDWDYIGVAKESAAQGETVEIDCYYSATGGVI